MEFSVGRSSSRDVDIGRTCCFDHQARGSPIQTRVESGLGAMDLQDSIDTTVVTGQCNAWVHRGKDLSGCGFRLPTV